MDYLHIQLNYLEKMAAGDPDTRRELLRMLVAELEDSAPRIRALWEKQNRAELQWLCHHLKTTFPFAGNEQLAGANREMEQRLRQGKDIQSMLPLLLKIEALLPKVLKELRRELEKR